MPRNYQPQKNNPDWLPHNVYMRVLYIIRDYQRMKAEQDAVMYTSPSGYSGPKNEHGDPTANKAVKIAMMSAETDAVDSALRRIPGEYQKAIWDNIVSSKPYMIPASRNTFRHWRSKFCHMVAEKLHYI